MRCSGGKVSDPLDVSLFFFLRGKATAEKIPSLFNIMKMVLLDSNLGNQKRAIEMLKETKARRETQIITNGHTYGASRLGARYTLLGYIGEVTGGLTYVRGLNALIEQAEKDWPSLERRLNNLRNAIVQRMDSTKLVLNLTGEDRILTLAKIPSLEFLHSIPKAAPESHASNLVKSFSAAKLLPTINEGFAVPAQVNYVVKGGSLFEPGEYVKSSYNVVSKYLSTGYLWDNVRVMGGAYGGFMRYSMILLDCHYIYLSINFLGSMRCQEGCSISPTEIPTLSRLSTSTMVLLTLWPKPPSPKTTFCKL